MFAPGIVEPSANMGIPERERSPAETRSVHGNTGKRAPTILMVSSSAGLRDMALLVDTGGAMPLYPSGIITSPFLVFPQWHGTENSFQRRYQTAMLTIGELYRSNWPPASFPTFIKQYDTRSHLPIRVFLPQSYDMSTGIPLPVLFTVHGGGFSMGSATDDDRWNRLFADTQGVMVVGLNHSKAPYAPYPTAIYDLEAVILAVMNDISLPIDRTRTAIGGSFSGATLAFAVAQLARIRTQVAFRAVFSSCGLLELGIPASAKAKTRPYKPGLSSARSGATDSMANALPSIQWGYTPAGTDMTDPLYAPFYAPASALPPHVCLLAAELDILAHDAWRMACRLAGRRVPGMEEQVGRPGVGARGMLELTDAAFGFEVVMGASSGGGVRSVKWLLVPDALHGFDLRLPDALAGDDESREDANMKTRQAVVALGQWLRGVVWGM
ncbi:hypothetical protein JX266_013634 [Neoarthrinium moseri]|nr:hypothetical protein JX266_013634 [Neoarthrinium moseri]